MLGMAAILASLNSRTTRNNRSFFLKFSRLFFAFTVENITVCVKLPGKAYVKVVF